MNRLLVSTLLLIGLLALTASASAQDCPSAPAPLLRLGQPAVIAPGIGPLNMRALPAVGTAVRGQLYAGSALTVIGGPSCNGRYRWWRVQITGTNRTGWIAEGSWEQYFALPVNTARRRPPTPFEWTCLPQFDSRPCFWP